MNQITIRRYSDSDFQAIWELNLLGLEQMGIPLNDLSHEDDLKDIINTYIKTGGEFLVGELRHRLIAMGALARGSNRVGVIKRMRVNPDFQRQGVGQALLIELERKAKELDWRELQLDTLAQNKTAQNFYIKNGYDEYKREMRWGFERVFFKKVL